MGSGVPLSSQKWRLINLDLKAPQLQRNAVSCREMIFTALGTCVHVQESPKNGLIFPRLVSVPGTCRPMLSGKDQPAFSVFFAVYTFLQAIAVALCQNQEEGRLGKAQLDASGCTQVPFKNLALGLLWSHGARHR